MTIPQTNGQQIELSLRDSVSDARSSGLIVERAWLPMVIWEGIRVIIRTKQGLTVMECFVIECLLTLGQCRADELLEIASIPPELADWLLGSLAQKSLAYRDGEWFSPNTDACARALDEKCVPIEHETWRSFLWFPETHELVVIPDALIQQLRHVRPSGTFPLPGNWTDATRGQVIKEAIKRGRIYGDNAGELWDTNDADKLDVNYPAYYCRALLPHDGNDQWQIAIKGYRKRKAHEVSRENAGSGANDMIEHALQIPVLPELARSWRDRLESAGDAINNRLEQQLGLVDVRRDGPQIVSVLAADIAKRISRERLLVNRVEVGVSIDGVIDYAMSMQLRPSSTDPAAQRLFALDEAVREILARNTSETAQMICVRRGLQVPEIVERLWDLKLFRKVYDLREAEDFSA